MEVRGQHDAAVELAQLAQPGRGELDVQHETARAHLLDAPVLSELQHDQPAGVAPQDPLQAVAQGVPGATALSEARIRPSAPALPPDFPGAAARSLAATALLRSQVLLALRARHSVMLTGETRAKSTGGPPAPVGPPRRRERGSTRRASPGPAATSRTFMPSGTLPGSAGTRACVKPSRCASESLRCTPVTRLTSPARPTSPIATEVLGQRRVTWLASGQGQRDGEVGGRLGGSFTPPPSHCKCPASPAR